LKPLQVKSAITVQPISIGRGFKALGLRGTDEQMDPFLMVDHYRMTEPTFGPHPHAGFCAVTYMFDDAQTGFNNRDSLGDNSYIAPGDNYWTIAGKGVIHDEVPTQLGKVAHGLQLFVNLRATDKHREPGSIHIKQSEMPIVKQATGARVKVAFGSYTDGPVIHLPVKPLPTDVTLLDVYIDSGQAFEYLMQREHNSFALIIDGKVNIQDQIISAGQAVHFETADGLLQFIANERAHVAVFMGIPLNEPVVRHGPFAMTNRTDIERAIKDYQSGEMGYLA
jgi:redox-sensitive bicupin YhaK (pirin superfamily)